jgi:NitT/TauT family transport system substrate-binding protein
MADALGYFEREKITASLTAGGPGTDYRTLVSSGRMLVSETNVNGMIDSVVQGQPIVAFAAFMQRDPSAFLSLPDQPVRTLEDMVGKTIGLPNSMRGQIGELMRRKGVDISKVRFVPVGTDARMLLARQVDAYYSWATTAAPGLRLAGVEPHILHMADIGVPGYGGLLFTRKDHLEKRFELFVRYTRALIGGWSYMAEHPFETAQTVVKNYAPAGTDLKEQTLQAEMMSSYIKAGDAVSRGMLWVKPDYFDNALRLARAAGVLPASSKVKAEDLVDQRVIRAAHGF